MKKLLFIFALLWNCAYAQDFTGISNTTLKNYVGGTLSNCTNVVIDHPTITSTLILNNCTNITIQGPKFSRAGMAFRNMNSGIRVYDVISVGVGMLVDASNMGITFTGSNYALKNFTMSGLNSDGGEVFQGLYGTYGSTNFIDSIDISNVVYNPGTNYQPVVAAACIYRYNFHDWKIKYTGIAPNGKDYAIFNINGGFGQIWNIDRTGGWGWLCRIFANKVVGGPSGDVWVYNTIDRNKACYGSIELRVEPQGIGTLTTGTNLHAVNNTAGNYKDSYFNGTYTNAIVMIMNCIAPYTAEVRNNVSFNCQSTTYNSRGGNIGGLNNFMPQIFSGNVYYSTYQAAGFTDDSTCNLLATSPLIDAGAATIATKDIAGITRPQGTAFDIGAREKDKGTPVVDPCPVCPTCPPPIVCPVCPSPPALRTVKSFIQSFDGVKLVWTFTYSDGGTSTLPQN